MNFSLGLRTLLLLAFVAVATAALVHPAFLGPAGDAAWRAAPAFGLH